MGTIYLISAYAVVWIGLFAFLAFIALRLSSVRTELAAVEALVREQELQQTPPR